MPGAADHRPDLLFGYKVWLGWIDAALLYSVVPPVILGRMKMPIAERLVDGAHTDAMMQRAAG